MFFQLVILVLRFRRNSRGFRLLYWYSIKFRVDMFLFFCILLSSLHFIRLFFELLQGNSFFFHVLHLIFEWFTNRFRSLLLFIKFLLESFDNALFLFKSFFHQGRHFSISNTLSNQKLLFFRVFFTFNISFFIYSDRFLLAWEDMIQLLNIRLVESNPSHLNTSMAWLGRCFSVNLESFLGLWFMKILCYLS